MNKLIPVLAVVLAAGLWAQVPTPTPVPSPMPPVRFPAALRLYLELSDTQVDNIIFLNNEYQRWAQARRRRMNQVQQELNDALAREPLDPMAIGLAMAEIEATQRQLRAELDRTRTKIRAVLNEKQQAKLTALEEVIKLWPIYSEAVGVNLLEPVAGTVTPVSGVVGVITQPGALADQP
jgi:hypothetical protein